MTTSIIPFYRPQQLLACRLASTANLNGTYSVDANGVATLTNAGALAALSVDSVTVEENNRILLKNQSSALQNGIWVVINPGSASAAWVLQRSEDFQSIEQIKAGMFVNVSAGTANAGGLFTVIEPLPSVLGTSDINWGDAANAGADDFLEIANNLSELTATAATARTNISAAKNGANTDITSVVLNNTGLVVKDTDASHNLSIVPGSDLTADRVFTLTTGDAARILDISAGNVTVSAFGATLVDDATLLAALTTLGVKRGTTAAYGGGGTTNSFTATGVVATDIVVATLLTSTNTVAWKAAPGAGVIDVTFASDPGANTVFNWIAIPTV